MPNPSNAPTERLLDEAGIGPGMRVLDVGSAMGLLTRYLALRVGPKGSVLGIDYDKERIDQARDTASPPDAGSIEYRKVDLSQPLPDLGVFDAVVGRRVLMYLPNPAATVAMLVPLLKPGGIMAWHEHTGLGCPIAKSPIPAHARAHEWLWSMVEAEGGQRGLGLDLPGLLESSGVAPSIFRIEAITIAAQGAGMESGLRGMLPRIVDAGVLREGDVDPDALVTELAGERRMLDAPIIWDFACLAAGRRAG